MNKKKKTGVLLMTYGSPSDLDHIPSYLKNVYGGRDASEETIAEFRRRYALIGGSPLVEITTKQAAHLEQKLNESSHDSFLVRAGMRFSDPFIQDVMREYFSEVERLIGVILSPQYSPIIMSGYLKAFSEGAHALSLTSTYMVQDWHLQKYFIQALAERVQSVLNGLSEKERSELMILFSAHSMPKRVIENEPDYISHLKETAQAVADTLSLKNDQWMFCYQSAGHTPEEWLKPDFADLMPEIKKQGYTHVLIAPIQFLSDHLETLYDIDIGAREQADEHGIIFHRTQSLNTSPLFIQALAEVVMEGVSHLTEHEHTPSAI